jgi:flagellar M-ring protein FliF
MFEQFKTFAAELGAKRLALMGGVAVALLAVLATVSLGSRDGDMGFLYTDLDPAAAQSITQQLQAQNIPFRLSADGTSILAPQDRLAEARMSLATQGLGGPIGYEVLDSEQPFGLSSERAQLNQTRAIEGELARSIQTLSSVSAARVHLVIPERTVFGADGRKASASVTLKTRGKLPGETVQAVRQLVASAVPDLTPESVSVVDQSGRLLARAGDSDGASGSLDERQAAIEARLRDQVEALLQPIVGQGKVRAQVAVAMDRSQTSEQSRTFDPDAQVIAKQITVESGDNADENSAAPRGATVGAQLPEAQAAAAAATGPSRRTASNESSEEITYENSATERTVQRGPGAISRVTVAVTIDAKPKAPSQAELQRLTRLVENAVGFDAERGDSVAVEAIAFAGDEALADAEGSLLGLVTPDHLLTILKLLIIGGVGLIAIRMLRPRPGEASAAPGADAPAAVPQSPELMALASRAAEGDQDALHRLEAMGAGGAIPMLDQEIALAQVDGRVKLSALKRIGDTVAQSPAESASVIRQWITS